MKSKALALLVAAIALLAGIARPVAAGDKGIVYIDDTTFSRVVDGSRDVLVRFDKEYAWGEHHDAFKELAGKVTESGERLLVASVPVSSSEYSPTNVEVAKKYGAADEKKFPVYLLFPKGGDAAAPLRYPDASPKKTAELLSWVAQHSGAFFGLKGQVRELDALARELMAAGDDAARAAVAARGAGVAAGVTGADKQEAVQYYLKALSKAASAPEWPASEAKRLQGLLLAGKMSDDKRAALQMKANVLASFKRPAGHTEL